MPGSFADESHIFEDETVLYESYIPDKLPEREEELTEIHNALAPAARGARPHNMFVYGKTGQGKSAAVQHRLAELEEYAALDSNDLDVTVINYSCSKDKTSYQVTTSLVEELTGDNPWGKKKKEVFDDLYTALNNIGGTVIFVLDEIDTIGTDDDLLYEIPRARANGHIEDMWVSIIGISNDFQFRDNLSPKVKDTLAEDEIHFSPYDANQLAPILQRRSNKAFKPGVLTTDVIPLCAAFASQDKGSARQAIRYLSKSGEIASNNGDSIVTEDHVRQAEEKIERKNIREGIRGLTTQDHLSLAAVLSLTIKGQTPAKTRIVYGEYKKLAKLIEADAISNRRVRDHLLELDLVGIIEANKKGAGSAGGPHYTWQLNSDLGMTMEVFEEIDRFVDAMDRVKQSGSRGLGRYT